jgi:hypothetical protein
MATHKVTSDYGVEFELDDGQYRLCQSRKQRNGLFHVAVQAGCQSASVECGESRDAAPKTPVSEIDMFAWLRKILGNAKAIPADIRRLPATSERALSSSLKNLPQGERGWIALSEAARLFSTEEPAYAFGEMDDDGKRRLRVFAAACRSEVQFMPTERRVYFKREI